MVTSIRRSVKRERRGQNDDTVPTNVPGQMQYIRCQRRHDGTTRAWASLLLSKSASSMPSHAAISSCENPADANRNPIEVYAVHHCTVSVCVL
jgi:hypothetical protein